MVKQKAHGILLREPAMKNFWAVLNILYILLQFSQCQGQTFETIGELTFECPEGWKHYGGNCYFMVHVAMGWSEARDTCISYEAKFLIIDDEVENMELSRMAIASTWKSFWLGEKVSEDVLCRGYWGNYQPPETVTDGECIIVSAGGQWEVEHCEKVTPFFCKKPACLNGTFDCGYGRCINSKWVCDGVNDCDNNMDEMNCAARCSYYKTGSTGTLPQLIGYDNNADCLWTIEGPVGSQLKLTFSNVSTEQNADIIEVRSGSKSLTESSLVKTLSGDLTNQVIYSTNNFLIIRFTTDTTVKSSGFQAAWTSDVAELSQSVRNVTAASSWQELMTPFYPDTPPLGFRLEWLVSSAENTIITFEIVDVDLSSYWELLLYDGETFGHELLKASKDSTLRSPAIYMSSANKLRILLRLKEGESVVTGKGIKIRVKEGCSMSITAAHGKVYSPGFDRRMYPTSTKCDWTIMAPDSSKRPLQLKFLFFDLADDTDSLRVYSGHNSSGLVLHPSSGFKGNLTSNLTRLHGGNTLYLLFESSLIQANGGFLLEFSVDCPEITPSSDVILSTNSSQYEVEVMINCTEGYSFVQEEYNQMSSLSFMCEKAGMWNQTRFPTCQITYCGVPKATPNGYIANYSGAVTYQSQVTYDCYPGFQMRRSATVTCQANGMWEEKPSCMSSTCSTAPLVANATTNNTVGDGTSYGTIVKYTCEDGFELLGASQILCQTSGNWSHSPPSCIKIKCPIPKITRGAVDSSKPVNFQDTVKLTCQKGFVASTSKNQSITLSCGANGKFEDVECEDEDECSTRTVCTQMCRNIFGSYECLCHDGYSGNGCSDTNECDVNNGGCDHKCDNSVFPYACSCNEGYSLFMSNGTNNRSTEKGETGLRSGDVYYINHTCVPNTCNRPPDLANGTIHSKRDLFYFEDKLTYSCRLGWTLKGSSVRTCLENGNWSGTEPSCEEAFCPPLEIVGEDYNKARMVQISPNTSITFGEKVILQCRLENNTILSKALYCAYDVNNGNYSLQGDTPICPVVDCKTPNPGPGALKPSVSMSTLVGSSFEFECSGSVEKVGESTLGNFTVECQSNGLWGLKNLTCKAPRCSDPGTPGGSVQIVRSYEEGQMLIYNCTRDGYEPNPSTPLLCQIVGNKAEWNGSVPQCKDATKPVFSNCSKETIYVDLMEAAGFNAPTATDNSGLLKFLVVDPASFDPMQPITGNTIVTYTAGDWEGNNETCVITIQLKDRTLPTLTCPDFLILNVSDTSGLTVNLSDFVDFGTGTHSVLPSINVSLQTYKQVLDHRVSTKSAVGYENTCAFQTEIRASKCFVEILNTLSGADVKSENVSGNLVVTVTCRDGYAFDGGLTSRNYNCTGENKWTPDLPLEDCIAYETTIYILKFSLSYKSTVPITQDCVNSHVYLLNSSLSASNSTLNHLYCWKKDGNSTYQFIASEIENFDVSYFELKTNVTLRVLNSDGDSSRLQTCQNKLNSSVDQIFSYSGFGCGTLTLNPAAKNVLDADASGDSCSSGLVLFTVGSNKQCCDLMTWGAYSVIYGAEDSDGNIGVCRFKTYILKEDCNKTDFPVGTETCGGKSIKDFCPSSQKMSVPMPFRKTCGKQGSYNLKDIFEKSIAPVCGATSIQKFSLNVKLKYVMKIGCSEFLLRTLKNDIKQRFINSIDTDWPDLCTSLCDNLEVTASCSGKAANVQLAFTGLKMKIKKSDNSLSLSPEEILKITALQDDRLQFRDAGNADLQKNNVSFDQFASCDNGSRILGQQCVECGPGSFFNTSTRICDLCPVGKYTASPKLTKCEDCGSGKTTIRAGSRNIKDCIATCPPGSYFETKESKCVECPQDFYQEKSGKDYCLPCPFGNHTRNSGTVSKDQCFADCPSGTELLSNGTCKDCERGYYRTQTVSDACVQCPSGNITRKSGSMSRSDCKLPDCPAGSYISDTELTCNKCPYGQYQPMKWMMKCLKCKPNYTTEIEGTSKESDCKFVCDPGKEEYPANSTTCRLCPRGTFRSDSLDDRFRACNNCSVNMTTEEGAKNVSECSIVECAPGTKYVAVSSVCIDCPIGFYQDQRGQTTCKECGGLLATKSTKTTKQSECICE